MLTFPQSGNADGRAYCLLAAWYSHIWATERNAATQPGKRPVSVCVLVWQKEKDVCISVCFVLVFWVFFCLTKPLGWGYGFWFRAEPRGIVNTHFNWTALKLVSTINWLTFSLQSEIRYLFDKSHSSALTVDSKTERQTWCADSQLPTHRHTHTPDHLIQRAQAAASERR